MGMGRSKRVKWWWTRGWGGVDIGGDVVEQPPPPPQPPNPFRPQLSKALGPNATKAAAKPLSAQVLDQPP